MRYGTFSLLVFEIADILFLGRIKEKVADRSNERINTQSKISKDEVRPSSGGVAFGLQRSVVDNQTADPTEEERQQETDQFGVIDRIVIRIVFHETGLLS